MSTLVDMAWWRHQMETFSALLAICAGNAPVPGEFPAQRPVTRSFGVFFDLRLNKRLSKQSWGWWFETLLRPLWRHCNGLYASMDVHCYLISLLKFGPLWSKRKSHSSICIYVLEFLTKYFMQYECTCNKCNHQNKSCFRQALIIHVCSVFAITD